jgi:hypothetical protein
MWSSEDDLTWTSTPLELGTPIVRPRLSANADGLLLTASVGSNDALWRGIPGPELRAFSWSQVPLRAPEGLSEQVLTTAVATDGNVIAVLGRC